MLKCEVLDKKLYVITNRCISVPIRTRVGFGGCGPKQGAVKFKNEAENMADPVDWIKELIKERINNDESIISIIQISSDISRKLKSTLKCSKDIIL
jgi:hypothetical protein